jgi:hypothetical protein
LLYIVWCLRRASYALYARTRRGLLRVVHVRWEYAYHRAMPEPVDCVGLNLQAPMDPSECMSSQPPEVCIA